MINRTPTLMDMISLWQHCASFIENQNITCAETVYQSDRVFNQLLNACSVADEVNVSTDDLAVIGPWIRGEK
jgi:hypothetical protein